jgi:lysophospholipase L1-like esterase
MKLPFLSSIRAGAACGRAIFLLVVAGAFVARAQEPGAPAAQSTPAFLFPTNQDLLPGKGPVQKWKDFPKRWSERRSVFWAERDQDRGAVVFLGDSITQGWKNLAADFPDLKVANRGISGDITRGVLFRLKEDVLDLHPSAVVLLIGINDINNGGEPEQIAANIAMILQELEESDSRLPIILCKVMPSKRPVAFKIRELNALLDEAVRTDSRVIPCDTWSLYAANDGTCYHGEFPDMLHPNNVGYAQWAAALRPIFAGLNLAVKKDPQP